MCVAAGGPLIRLLAKSQKAIFAVEGIHERQPQKQVSACRAERACQRQRARDLMTRVHVFSASKTYAAAHRDALNQKICERDQLLSEKVRPPSLMTFLARVRVYSTEIPRYLKRGVPLSVSIAGLVPLVVYS